MRFDKANANAIQADALKILQQRLAECGITVEAAGGTYYDHEYPMKFKLPTTNESGESQAALDFKRYASSYGLRADQLATTFNHNGERYSITGLKPRAKSYPIIAECIRGKHPGQEYGFRPSVVKGAV